MSQDFKFRKYLLRALVLGVGVLSSAACGQQRYLVAFSFWNATNVDYAEAFVHSLDGVLLHEEVGFPPASINREGWRGGGVDSRFDSFPEEVLISWRLPSPQETAAERCARRMEFDCEKLGSPGRVNYRDGQLFGPYKVNLRTRLPDDMWRLLNRRGFYNILSFGFSVGVEPPLVRWQLEGKPPHAKIDDPGVGVIGYGGDWGYAKPFGWNRPTQPLFTP
jgi:hypothetical protein